MSRYAEVDEFFKTAPPPPKGYRLVTPDERDGIRGLSGYLYAYPLLLHRVRCYDSEYGWKKEGPYKYLWDDAHYAVPKDLPLQIDHLKKTMRYSDFEKIVDHVFPMRSNLEGRFDYPDYGGLPRLISRNLSPESVDAMQDILQLKFVRKRDFAKAYKKRLEELGEIVGKSPRKQYV